MGILRIQLMSFSHGSLSTSLAAMFDSGLRFGANVNGKKSYGNNREVKVKTANLFLQ